MHRIIKSALVGCLLCLSTLSIHNVFAATVSGPVDYFHDGDTFVIGQQTIRLVGIDAPETAQNCKNNKGRFYPCGETATNYLKSLIKDNDVTCEGDSRDQYGRLIALCFAGDLVINAHMVLAGWAVAYTRFDDRYKALESSAKRKKRGIWQGEFVRPGNFRSGVWEDAEKNIKKSTQKDGENCLIKGNINANGDRVYHTPWGSKHYNKTRINTKKGERWFCDEKAALNAGWRPPYR